MPTWDDIPGDTRLATSEATLSTAIPGEIVILDPDSGQYFGLDGVGARVWELLETTPSLNHLVRTISSEYEMDAATCESDLRSLLQDLGARGLVRTVD
jgi:hypothetical protein